MESSEPRASIFQENFDTVPLKTSPITTGSGKRLVRPTSVRFRSQEEIHVVDRLEDADLSGKTHQTTASRSPHTKNSLSIVATPSQSPLPVRNRSTMYRFGTAALLLVAALPLLHSTSFFGHAALLQHVTGSTIPKRSDTGPILEKRADSPTNVCFRWAQQSALVNGTLYLYGGQATTEPNQGENTWNNNFLSLDLTKNWQIATPSLTGLPQPSGPPNVSLGALWNSHDSLYLYGGQFQWKPKVDPTAFSLWEYSISDSQWVEHSNPTTSQGQSAPSHGDPVQRAAEGASANVPSLGRAFYFGGHLDDYTTEEWSNQIARVYLQSLLEYTFPGYQNDQVDALANDQAAGSDGSYRNITEGGLQSQAGFTQRADGLLIYVPGFGEQGILLALAGGTNGSFTQMNTVNVYDIANSTWYTQSTTGPTPALRVNPCSVIAAAPDGSSYNIYMFGGQNLIPFGDQTQKNDMWILTLPSFTWIEVNTAGQSVPYGRSGHTCNVWDSQMVMVGGYTGSQDLTCESPGIYVFDLSALEWVNQFTALSAGTDDDSSSAQMDTNGSGSTGANNPFNQQPAQRYSANSAGGLEGSYGYTVPQAVIDVVGGDKSGGATLTEPVNTATAGPLATGKPITYTVTNADGSTTTSTSTPGSSGFNNGGGGGVNVGAIVAGCVAGVLFVIACYLAFCAYVYRRQLQLYKRHVEMSQAQARGEKIAAIPGLLATNTSSNNGKETPSDPSHGGTASRWATGTSSGGSHHTRNESGTSSNGRPRAYNAGYNAVRRNSDISEPEDLLAGNEPTFVGVLLNPRRSLRIVNRD